MAGDACLTEPAAWPRRDVSGAASLGLAERDNAGVPGCGLVAEHARQQLGSNEQGQGRPAGDHAAGQAGPGIGDIGGQAAGGSDHQGGPRQPPGSPPAAVVGEQDEQGDDLDAVDRERERVRVPPGVAVGGGELAHMAVANLRDDERCSHARSAVP
jgi:hypothetical protein